MEAISCCGTRFAQSGSERKNKDKGGERKNRQFGLKRMGDKAKDRQKIKILKRQRNRRLS
jgi:hypothetical protein